MTDDPAGRCPWAASSPSMLAYHDEEWGRPCHDERTLLELLNLEGAQAGLSWSTILAKRDGYRRAFDGFDPERVAAYGAARVAELLGDPGIVRNRSKVLAVIGNAAAYSELVATEGSLDRYLWDWVGGVPEVHHPLAPSEVPASSALSERVSRDLKRRGFRFVGPTIVQAWLQATGVVDDHLDGCPAKPSPAA